MVFVNRAENGQNLAKNSKKENLKSVLKNIHGFGRGLAKNPYCWNYFSKIIALLIENPLTRIPYDSSINNKPITYNIFYT